MLFFPIFPFDPPENIRKPLGFRVSPSEGKLGHAPSPTNKKNWLVPLCPLLFYSQNFDFVIFVQFCPFCSNSPPTSQPHLGKPAVF